MPSSQIVELGVLNHRNYGERHSAPLGVPGENVVDLPPKVATWFRKQALAMCLDRRMQFLDGRRRVLRPDEEQQSCLAVTPYQVSKKLVDSLCHSFRTAPYLAFTDEYISVVRPNQYVGFSTPVEEFSACRALPIAIEMGQQEIA